MGNLQYKQSGAFVADLYKEAAFKYDMTRFQEKGRQYNDLVSMLKENFFLGSTRFGENFIA